MEESSSHRSIGDNQSIGYSYAATHQEFYIKKPVDK